jgi:ribose-phosphate pyrophosphokinase
VITKDIKINYKDKDIVVISPDVGGVVRARGIAKRIDGDLAIVDKRRDKANESEVMNIIGDINGRDCIIVDDIVDTAGTLCNAAEALIKAGAKSVSAYITHGVLSGPAVERIKKSKLDELVITDSIAPTKLILDASNIRILHLAPLIAEAIRRISSDSSVSSLFD